MTRTTPYPGTMMRSPHSEKTELHAWKLVERVTEALHAEYGDEPPTLELALTYGCDEGKQWSGDPVMLDIILPLGRSSDGEAVSYSCSLEGPVELLIEVARDWVDKTACIKVAARLRELADKLDAAGDRAGG